MAKTITSPVKHFPGTVTLFRPVTYPQYIAWVRAVHSQRDGMESETQPEGELTLWGGVKALVEVWDIPNFDLDNIPASPRAAVVNLLSWLITEIGTVINEDDEDPN